MTRVGAKASIMGRAMVVVYLLQKPVVELNELGEADAVVVVRVELCEAFLDLIKVGTYTFTYPGYSGLDLRRYVHSVM